MGTAQINCGLQMKMIDVDGVKLNYQEKGTGPTLILIHGIPTDYRAWDEQVEVLSKNFRTITYSRRCAFPNQNKDYADSTIENNEKDLEGLIAQIGGSPVHLVAHSYGGAVAAHCALKRPDLVRSLVLIEPWLLTMLLKDPDSKIQNLSFLLRKPSVAMSGRKAMKNTLAMYKELDQKNMEKVLQMFLDGLQDQPNTMKQYSTATLEMMRANVGTVGELRTKSPLFTKYEARRLLSPLYCSPENDPSRCSIPSSASFIRICQTMRWLLFRTLRTCRKLRTRKRSMKRY